MDLGRGRGSNPWNRGRGTQPGNGGRGEGSQTFGNGNRSTNQQHGRGKKQANSDVGKKSNNNGQSINRGQSAEEKFELERRKLEESVKKLNYQDSSDEDDYEQDGDALRIVTESYVKHGGGSLGRTQTFLDNSGPGVCLICISTVKRLDPVWNCGECYGCFHIVCVQKWARDSLFQQRQALEDLPVYQRTSKISWACPKCRKEYEEAKVPEKYYCYCTKTVNPQPGGFVVPHACSQVCDRPLIPHCGHNCLLLCHAGPCPPCPRTVKSSCFCGKKGPEAKRCGEKLWSCQKACGKSLACNKHKCEAVCHAGECPPCARQSEQWCDCRGQKILRPCSAPRWKCEKVCGKPFSCGFHRCELVCHGGECGPCIRSLPRTCPCNKTETVAPCTQDIPTCGETCDKLLGCQIHRCQSKCHKGNCVCLEKLVKSCRCRLHSKEVACDREYTCETKCKKMKACQKHPCNRKCCDGCGPCEKPCARTLPCGTHKCPAVCHRGACYPCPLTAEVSCRCKQTSMTVPCGRERKTRPPKCKIPCKINPDCHHPSRDHHRCHFGDCPPCKQICGQILHCGHSCPLPCHSSVWVKVEDTKRPAGPWEVVEPTFRRQTLPCPPCSTLVPVRCIGEHETGQLPCSESQRYSCGRECGRILQCGNHTCDLECHSDPADCAECEQQCSRSPPEGCTHPCLRNCHPEPCKRPCRALVKVKCHCGISELHVECFKLTTGAVESMSCGNFCPNNYPCGHKCKSVCHPGPCPDSESCRRKTKVHCPCGRIKKEIPCDVFKKGGGKVDCDGECETKKLGKQAAKELELARQQEEAEKKNREEVEKFEKKLYGKKKTKERKRFIEEEDESFLAKYWIVLSAGCIAVAIGSYFLLV